MDDDVSAVFGVMFVVVGHLIDEKAVSRPKLIDYLQRVIADLPEAERQTKYGKLLDAFIAGLEKTQFR